MERRKGKRDGMEGLISVRRARRQDTNRQLNAKRCEGKQRVLKGTKDRKKEKGRKGGGLEKEIFMART